MSDGNLDCIFPINWPDDEPTFKCHPFDDKDEGQGILIKKSAENIDSYMSITHATTSSEVKEQSVIGLANYMYMSNYQGYDLDKEIGPNTMGNLLTAPNQLPPQLRLRSSFSHFSIGRGRGMTARHEREQKALPYWLILKYSGKNTNKS